MSERWRRRQKKTSETKETDISSIIFHALLMNQRRKVEEVMTLRNALEELSEATRTGGLRYSSSMFEILQKLSKFDEDTQGETHKTLCYLIGGKLISPEISFAQLGYQLDSVLEYYNADIFEEMDRFDQSLEGKQV